MSIDLSKHISQEKSKQIVSGASFLWPVERKAERRVAMTAREEGAALQADKEKPAEAG